MRSSTTTMADQEHQAAGDGAQDLGLCQPRSGPSLIPNMTAANPMPDSRKPGMSNRPSRGWRLSTKKRRPKAKASTPIGRLTKNTHRHERVVTNRPPSTGPRAGATAVGTVRMLEARTRSAGGKTRNSMAMPTGVSMPPPTPCSTRKPTSSARLSASPHSTEAPVKTAMAKRRTRLVPMRSPSQPGGRDEDGQADQVADGHGVERGLGHPELVPDGGDGHVHDGDVHDVHEHGGDEDDADRDLLVQPARRTSSRSTRRGRRAGRGGWGCPRWGRPARCAARYRGGGRRRPRGWSATG